jgi:hypothetical protein
LGAGQVLVAEGAGGAAVFVAGVGGYDALYLLWLYLHLFVGIFEKLVHFLLQNVLFNKKYHTLLRIPRTRMLRRPNRGNVHLL